MTMPKTARDPFFATLMGPDVIAGRHAAVVTADPNNDLPAVTRSLIVTIGSGGTGLTVILADDADSQPVTIPLALGTFQLNIQARRVSAATLGTGGAIVATWG